MTIFDKPEDFDAFKRVLEEAVERTETRLLYAGCILFLLSRNTNQHAGKLMLFFRLGDLRRLDLLAA